MRTIGKTRPYAILMHGLGRTRFSMQKLAKSLTQQGYQVVNFTYPSQRLPIAELSAQVIPKCLQACYDGSASHIHFVTHSMGGILLRHYLQHHTIERLSNCVMLAPPNQGSELAEKLRRHAWYRYLNGPAGGQLGAGSDSVPLQLGTAGFPLGIIAGNQSALWDRYFATLIPAPNDGKVTVESAKLDGMRDFLVVPCNHTSIMNNESVISQILYFLQFTRFQHSVILTTS